LDTRVLLVREDGYDEFKGLGESSDMEGAMIVKPMGWLLVAVMLALAGGAMLEASLTVAEAAEPSAAELRAQIAEQEAKLNDVRQRLRKAEEQRHKLELQEYRITQQQSQLGDNPALQSRLANVRAELQDAHRTVTGLEQERKAAEGRLASLKSALRQRDAAETDRREAGRNAEEDRRAQEAAARAKEKAARKAEDARRAREARRQREAAGEDGGAGSREGPERPTAAPPLRVWPAKRISKAKEFERQQNYSRRRWLVIALPPNREMHGGKPTSASCIKTDGASLRLSDRSGPMAPESR
jgi:septal ring factor EnvC (AmiA/AmiB activator)